MTHIIYNFTQFLHKWCKNNYLILSGGTGGHVMPAVNFGNFIIEKGYKCCLLIDKRGERYTSSFKGQIRIINSSHFSYNFFGKIRAVIFHTIGFLQSLKYILIIRPRSCIAFGGYATKNPEALKFIAVSEPDEYRRNRFGDAHNISSENRFNTWEDLLKVPKLASVLFNATGDDTHYLSSMSAMDKGYDVVLEKPMASTSEECSALVEKSDKLKKKLIIFHELRYTSFFQKVYEIVNSGKLGDIITVEHIENVV